MFKYEYWLDGNCLHEDDTLYETESEAEDAAREDIQDRIEEWKSEDCWDGETVNDFVIKIKEVDG